MTEEKKEKKPLTHYIGIGVAVATILSVVGSYAILFIFLFSARSRPWQVVEKGIETAKIAVINLRGTIFDSDAQYSNYSYLQIVKNSLRDIKEDKNVKAVILRINSPGGDAVYIDRIYDEIKRFQKKNPNIQFFSFVETMAASGGYYLACASDYIMAERESIVGSIGVIWAKLNLGRLLDKIGVQFEVVKSSGRKDFSGFWRSMSDEEKAMINKMIMFTYDTFLSIIMESRRNLPPEKKMTLEKLKTLADGSIYTTKDALDYGLIDGIGYFPDIIEKVKEKIKEPNAKVSEYLPRRTFFENLFGERVRYNLLEKQILSYSGNIWLLWEGYLIK